jgi:H+/Cl- antiporter ClcA
MSALKKTWNWIGTAFIVLGIIGGMIALFLIGLGKYSTDFIAGVVSASALAFVFGVVTFMILINLSEEKSSSNKEELSEEQEFLVE